MSHAGGTYSQALRVARMPSSGSELYRKGKHRKQWLRSLHTQAQKPAGIGSEGGGVGVNVGLAGSKEGGDVGRVGPFGQVGRGLNDEAQALRGGGRKAESETLFAGNTKDASTVHEKIAELQREYGLKDVIFVGDRGMVTRSVAEKVKGVEGLHTISALTHPEIFALVERKVISADLFDEKEIVEVLDPENPARRYCLCRNPKSAQRETSTRLRLLQCPREGLEKIAGSKRRAKEGAVGARVGRVLQQYKMGKFVRWEVSQGRLSWSFE